MTRLILNRLHTHAGRLHAPGDALEVDLTTADWLIGQGVAHPEPELAIVQADPEPEPKTKARSPASLRQEPQP
jgi:hypothetical protein